MIEFHLDAARIAGRAAFEADPEAPFEAAVQARYRGAELVGLDGVAFQQGWCEAQDAHLSSLSPRGRSLYRFRCRDRLDAWRKENPNAPV